MTGRDDDAAPGAAPAGPPREVPVVFGPGCAGWWHAAAPDQAPDRARGRAVVLCAALGADAMCVHRPWRDLARALAAAGLPTLRFDYPNAGESAGEAEDAPDAGACVEATLRAAAEALRLSGAGELALVGLGFGGAIAALAAGRAATGTPTLPATRVAALALLAPVVSGRSYGRELRLRAEPDAMEGGALEVSGYPMSPAALAAIAALDPLGAVAAPPPRRVLVLERPSQSREAERLVAAYAAAGSDASREPFPGYDRMMVEAELSETPRAAFDRVVDALSAGAPAADSAPRPAPGAPVLDLGAVTETVVRFGADEGLVGSWCVPAGGVAPGAPVLLSLGMGGNPRAVRGRLMLLMARRMAAAGVPVLRFDARGVGDSDGEGLPRDLLYQREQLDDARAALDWLERRGHRQVVLTGICSGAYVALHLAAEDARVAATVPTNLPVVYWPAGQAVPFASAPRNLLVEDPSLRAGWAALRAGQPLRMVARSSVPHALYPAAKRLRTLKRRAARSVQWLRARLHALVEARLPGLALLHPEAVRARRMLRDLSARGVRVRFLYGTEDEGRAVLARHVGPDGRMLANLSGVAVSLLDKVNHSLTRPPMRVAYAVAVSETVREIDPARASPRARAAPGAEDAGASPSARAAAE